MLTLAELEKLVEGTRLTLKDEKSPDEPRFQLNGEGVDFHDTELYKSFSIGED